MEHFVSLRGCDRRFLADTCDLVVLVHVLGFTPLQIAVHIQILSAASHFSLISMSNAPISPFGRFPIGKDANHPFPTADFLVQARKGWLCGDACGTFPEKAGPPSHLQNRLPELPWLSALSFRMPPAPGSRATAPYPDPVHRKWPVPGYVFHLAELSAWRPA